MVSEVALEAGVLVLAALVGVEHVYVALSGVGHQELVEGIWHFVLGVDELDMHIVSAVIYKQHEVSLPTVGFNWHWPTDIRVDDVHWVISTLGGPPAYGWSQLLPLDTGDAVSNGVTALDMATHHLEDGFHALFTDVSKLTMQQHKGGQVMCLSNVDLDRCQFCCSELKQNIEHAALSSCSQEDVKGAQVVDLAPISIL